MMEIKTILKNTIKKFIDEPYNAIDPYGINNGLCDDFAGEVITQMGGYSKELYDFCCENFMNDNDELDITTLNHYGKLPNGLKPNDIQLGSHIWVYYKGKHYDAECVGGVRNFFDLPFFKRKLKLKRTMKSEKKNRICKQFV